MKMTDAAIGSKHHATCELEYGEDRLKVFLHAVNTSRGWSCTLTGGESPHVGGVVLAVPRPSLTGAGKGSCDIYSVPVPNHLDNEVGADLARMLACAFGQPASVTSGIHVENATAADLTQIRNNVSDLARMLVQEVES